MFEQCQTVGAPSIPRRITSRRASASLLEINKTAATKQTALDLPFFPFGQPSSDDDRVHTYIQKIGGRGAALHRLLVLTGYSSLSNIVTATHPKRTAEKERKEEGKREQKKKEERAQAVETWQCSGQTVVSGFGTNRIRAGETQQTSSMATAGETASIVPLKRGSRQ